MNIDNEQIFIPVDTAYYRQVQEEHLLMDDTTGEFFIINDVGKLIWESLNKGKTVEDIISAVLEEYTIDRPTAQTDVLVFLGEMLEKKLIQAK